jgi:hypothetical protein
VIDKSHLTKSLHHMLERPELADLVIPDLAKWEDWSVMDQLMDLFKKADEKTSWVRVPVINYLRACPLPRAKELLSECEKLDPAAVKRANTFFPSTNSETPDANKASRIERKQQRAMTASYAAVTQNVDVVLASAETAVEESAEDEAPAKLNTTDLAEAKPAGAAVDAGSEVALSVNPGATPAAAIREISRHKANRWLVLGVPWAVGVGLLIVQWSLLRGRG